MTYKGFRIYLPGCCIVEKTYGRQFKDTTLVNKMMKFIRDNRMGNDVEYWELI